MPFSKELSLEYFRSSGLVTNLPPDPGVLLARMFSRSAPQAVAGLLRTGRINEAYFSSDEQIRNHLQFCEALAYVINQHFMGLTETRGLKGLVENSFHHGIDHFRRAEKYSKAEDASNTLFRRDPNYLYFAPSRYLALYFHDLVEVYTGEKEYHDSGSALLTLGYLLNMYDHVRDLTSSSQNGSFIPQEDWEMIAWGTAFICRYHSKPEKTPQLESLLKDGILDPQELLRDAVAAAQKNHVSLFEFFPGYKSAASIIQQIQNNSLRVPQFTREKIEGLLKELQVTAAADKLDDTHPAAEAAARMNLTVPDRVFLDGSYFHLSLAEEYERRRQDGGAHRSSCDLNRILFMLSRTGVTSGLSWSSQMMRVGLKRRAEFYQQAIPGFLVGDFSTYLSPYETFVQREMHALLIKAGVDSYRVNSTLNISDPDVRRRSLRTLLAQRGLHPGVVDIIQDRIFEERDQVQQILGHKYQLLKTMNLGDRERQRIVDLLQMSIQQQYVKITKVAIPLNLKLPYTSYFILDLAALDRQARALAK